MAVEEGSPFESYHICNYIYNFISIHKSIYIENYIDISLLLYLHTHIYIYIYVVPQKNDVFEVATLLGQITLFSLSSSGGYHIYIYTHMYVLIVVLLLNPGT